MKEFSIKIESFADVQHFVSLATVQPFRVLVTNDSQQVNAKSFIGLVSLDCTKPLRVLVDCNDAEYDEFLHAAAAFLA